ncbi:hypothetical protein BDQ17DRAFT_1306152 [Cyathus striatus]|nr:hypothetical protein BDQ17DRAFT_1306152 [Cyathus striatus]
MIDVPKTFGALFVGGIISAIFTGVAIVQTFAYFKFYPKDRIPLKILVYHLSCFFMLIDICHIIFVTCAVWYYVIENFGKPEMIDDIPWSLAFTIAFTAILTFLVHTVYCISKDNYIVSVPLVSNYRIYVYRSILTINFRWSFTAGLALSAVLDVLITACLCFYLKSKQKKNSSLNSILDSLMLYAFESGSLTCAATLVSLICWLTMKHNLIFMGLHFVISKRKLFS